MSLSLLTGQPRHLIVDGQTFTIYPLTFDDLGQLQGWIDQQFPDLFSVVNDAITRGNYTVAQQQFLMEKAIEKSSQPKHLIGTPEADRLLTSIEGTKRMLALSIRKGNPGFTDAEAEALFKRLTQGHLVAAFSATGVNLVMADPKGGNKKSGKNGSSTSRRRPQPAAVSTGGNCTTKR